MLNQESYDPLASINGINTQKNSMLSSVNGSAGNTTLLASQMGETFLFDTAAGITYTLPAPVIGAEFNFIVTTTATSSNHKIITDAATTFLLGVVIEGSTNSTPSLFQGNGTSHISITMNGSTTGGVLGGRLRFKAVTATKWEVDGLLPSASSQATPFANT